MSAIRIKNLSFSYGDKTIFDHLNLILDTDWKLALTGRNGRGKTTLLRILCGELEYAGQITAGEDFVYFPPKTDESLDALSALYSAYPALELWRLKAELSALDMQADILDRQFASLSPGEKTRLLAAALFSVEYAFPLIDEPTNHLDAAGRKKFAAYLKNKRGFLLVSHDRAFLDACCDHVLVLEKEGYELRGGSFSAWWEDKQARDSSQRAQNERLKKQISELEKSARRTSEWAAKTEASKNEKVSGLKPDKGHVGAMAAKMARSAKNMQRRTEKAIEEKSALLKNADFYGELKLPSLPFRSEKICTVTHASVKYGDSYAFRDICLCIERGDRIAVSGQNGCGKTSLLRLVTKELNPSEGSLSMPSDAVISYLPQDTRSLSGSVFDCAKAHGAPPEIVMAILNKLDFRSDLFSKDVSAFSDGQKKKTALAISLATPAHLYVWDEPLNYIDLVSRIQLEELILRSCPTMLFVEHDALFCGHIATKTLFLGNN